VTKPVAATTPSLACTPLRPTGQLAAAVAGSPDFCEYRLQRRHDLIPALEIALERRLGADGLAQRMELAHRQLLHEARTHPWRDDEQPVRPAMIRGELGQELVVGDTGRSGQAGFLTDCRPDRFGGGGRRTAVQLRHGNVKVGFVQRERLDQRRVAREDAVDLLRHRLVDVETRGNEYPPRALSPGCDRQHGRVHAKSPRLVTRGRRHAALSRSADGHGFTAQVGAAALLHGRVERVRVDVNDTPVNRRRPGVGHAAFAATTESAACAVDGLGSLPQIGKRRSGPLLYPEATALMLPS